MDKSRIIAVVGFSRCGSSLTMRLLHALGVPTADESKVSFEHSKANLDEFDAEWLSTLRGQAVKLLEPQHLALPRDLPYDFIWCSRNPAEQARSQIKFLRLVMGFRLATAADVPRMARGIIDDTPRVQAELRKFPDHRWFEIHFENTLAEPFRAASSLSQFLGLDAGYQRIEDASFKVVKRTPKCYRGMLEMQYLNEEP